MVTPRIVERRLRNRFQGARITRDNSRLRVELIRAVSTDSLIDKLAGWARLNPRGRIKAEATLYPQEPSKGIEYEIDDTEFENVCEETGVSADYEITDIRPEDDKATVKITVDTLDSESASDFFLGLDRTI